MQYMYYVIWSNVLFVMSHVDSLGLYTAVSLSKYHIFVFYTMNPIEGNIFVSINDLV